MNAERDRRPVRSYVRREGRMTPAQQAALEALLPAYGWPAGRAAPAAVFGRDAPLVIEIGFGNGDNLLEQARQHPQRNFLGLEVHRPGVGSLLRRAQELELANLRVACEDAAEFLPAALPAGCADVVQVFFPDPWPKKRHHKRRLVATAFLDRAARVLRPGGRLLLATDWDDYAEQMLDALQAHSEFANLQPEGGFSARAERVDTRFEQRARRLGHRIHDLAFTRR